MLRLGYGARKLGALQKLAESRGKINALPSGARTDKLPETAPGEKESALGRVSDVITTLPWVTNCVVAFEKPSKCPSDHF